MIFPFMLLQLLTCDGVPPPPPVIDVVIEQNPARYSGPACLPEDAVCTPPADWDDREFLADGSARYEFVYVGELKAVERNGTWESDELVMLPTGIPGACWAWTWRPVQ